MNSRTPIAASRPRRGWFLLAMGWVVFFSFGCNPQALSVILGGITDNKVDPEYKIFAANKEVKLVILSNFAEQQDLNDVIQPTDTELAERLTQSFRKRCEENKHKIRIESHVSVSSYQRKNPDATPLEVGKHFKADYVLDLKIHFITLYERGSGKQMYRGNTEIGISLFKMDAKEGEHAVFDKDLRIEYPGARPVPVETVPAAFRSLFLTKVARDISKMFIAFPPEENRMIE